MRSIIQDPVLEAQEGPSSQEPRRRWGLSFPLGGFRGGAPLSWRWVRRRSGPGRAPRRPSKWLLCAPPSAQVPQCPGWRSSGRASPVTLAFEDPRRPWARDALGPATRHELLKSPAAGRRGPASRAVRAFPSGRLLRRCFWPGHLAAPSFAGAPAGTAPGRPTAPRRRSGRRGSAAPGPGRGRCHGEGPVRPPVTLATSPFAPCAGAPARETLT